MSTQEKTYKILNKEELENSELELEVEVPYQTLENHRSEAIKSLSKDLEVSGFRKGSVPENIAVQKLGEMNILEHSAYKTLNTLIPLIITSEKINALTEPQINITKIAPKSDLVFKMKVVLLPKVELADYKKIASDTKKIDDTPVTEKEMDEYIEYLRNQRAKALKTSDDKEEKVPEFDDEFVKSLGDFKNVEDFKTQLKENMLSLIHI